MGVKLRGARRGVMIPTVLWEGVAGAFTAALISRGRVNFVGVARHAKCGLDGSYAVPVNV